MTEPGREPRLAKWRCRYGSWWMIQILWDWWFSFGIHVDLKRRRSLAGTFGPYVDLHLGIVIVSLGWHPYLSSDLERVASYSRGGPAVDGTGRVY